MADREVYAFGEFLLELGERRLTKSGRAITLAPKAFDVLLTLIRRSGQLVSKRELLEQVWADAFVEEGILAVHVSALRKALGDSARQARFIETVSRSGYRFTAPVSEAGADPAATGARWPTAVLPARPLTGASGGRLLGSVIPDPPQSARLIPEVYELCARGRSQLFSASIFEVPKALESFRAALALDDSYAPAHAGVALAHCAQAALRLAPPCDAYRDARTAALRALAMDHESADAHVALGTVLLFAEWDWRGAERSLRRALEINPHHVQAYLVYGRLLDALGRRDAALAAKFNAFERDPLSPVVHIEIALSFWNHRRYDDAIEWANRALALDPRHLLAREFLAGAYLMKGDFDRYMAENLAHAAQYGVSPESLEPLRAAYAAGGRSGVVQYSLDQLASMPHREPAMQLALLFAEAGNPDAAFLHLDRAIDERDPSLVDLAVAPQWDTLRGDPRFEHHVTRMGLR